MVHKNAPRVDEIPAGFDKLYEQSGWTSREREAMGWALNGLASSEIAERMGVRPSTVRTYLQRACTKAGVSSVTALRPKLDLVSAGAASASDGRPVYRLEPRSHIPAIVVLGMTLSMVSRSADTSFAPVLAVPYLVIFSVGLVFYLAASCPRLSTRSVLFALVAGCVFLLLRLPDALPQIAAVFAVVLLFAAHATFASPRMCVPLASPIVSILGLLGGVLLGFAAKALFSLFSSSVTVDVLASCFGYLFGAASLIVLLIWFEALFSSAIEEVETFSADQEARARAYLAARSLSDLQVAVTLGIVRGCGGAELARELSYSRGSINSARRAAYAKLGVHSRTELLELFRRELGIETRTGGIFDEAKREAHGTHRGEQS